MADGCGLPAELLQASRIALPGARARLAPDLGDVIVDGAAIYGDGINVAARIESLCEPGGV